MINVKLTLLLTGLLLFTLSAACFASGYHVYDWDGAAKEKDGKEVRKSRWQPGFVLLADGTRRVGEIMVSSLDGRVAEVRIKGDGERRRTYATTDLVEFGLLLSVTEIEQGQAKPKIKFGPGTLEFSDGRSLQGILGAASFENGMVYTISYAPDRVENLTSYFSKNVTRAVMTINGLELEYLSSGDGFSKIPTLAEYRTFHHRDDSRNPHNGSVLLPDGELGTGQVLIVKDEDDGPAIGVMLFYEDGFGTIRVASELARVTQVIDQQSIYWTSYGSYLERLPSLQEYVTENHRDESRNAHPGQIVLRDEQTLEGSVAFVKSKNDVNSIEVLYFDVDGVPFSLGGSDVVQVTQSMGGATHRYIPYQDLVFVELLAEGKPYQIHANPFPERKDQFKSTLTRGLVSALFQVAAGQLGQQQLGNLGTFSISSCGVSGTCSSQNSLRQGVETMVPEFKKDEFIFSHANQGEVVVVKKNFESAIGNLVKGCSGYTGLTRKEKKAILDFDDPGRAITYLNGCTQAEPGSQMAATATPRQAEAGSVFQDSMRNNGRGPSMMVVPAGSYRMGDGAGTHDNEIPVHKVRFERPFAVSRFEITLEEFDRFTANTGRVKRSGQLSKQARGPVRGIAWIDAVAYAQWLSGQTGYNYRLPTEAEWEYAARADAITAYPWGENVSSERVRCEACGDKTSKSEDVGQFPANDFGLFDVVGGAWEWVADCWHPEFSGAPGDGSAWMDAGDCNLRVKRGGSAASGPEQLRLSFRTASNPVERGEFVGFRLVREL